MQTRSLTPPGHQLPSLVLRQLVVMIITIGLVIGVSAAVQHGHLFQSVAPATSHALSNELPLVRSLPPLLTTGQWRSYRYVDQGFSLQLPRDWSQQTVSSGDPDDGFYVVLGPHETYPSVGSYPGILAVSSSAVGLGTIGRLTQSGYAMVGNSKAQRTVWQSGNTQLVQYHFTRGTTFFLLQLTMNISGRAQTRDLDEIARRFSFNP